MMTNYAQIPNASFENWSNGAPVGWVTNNALSNNLVCILQSNDASAGASAAKLAVASFNGIDFGPVLYTDFAVSEKQNSLNGFYKFNPTQEDILSIAVTMSKNGTVIGEGTLELSSATSVYTSLNVNITYGINNIPDTCKIIFVIGSKDNQSAAHLGSYGLFDNLSFNNVTSVNALSLPNNYSLSQNYPNPFNPATIIKYEIPLPSNVKIEIFDLLGKNIETLVNKEQSAGSYKIYFNANKLSSGIYLYKITASNFIQTKKMILIR